MISKHCLRKLGLAGVLTLAMFGLGVALPAVDEPPKTAFVFRDVGDEAGLFPHVGGIAGHAAAWGDIDGDGWADLYVATFGGKPVPYGSKPNQLFRNVKGKFQLDKQEHLEIVGRAGGALFADLDNDGDLDLYLSNHAIKYAGQPHFQTPNYLFRNDGGGKLTDISDASGTRPALKSEFAGRSVAVLDYDGDGLLDLLVGECIYQGGEGRSRLFRNLGGLKFQDVSEAAGLPKCCTGLGVAAADVNGDGWPDIFLAGRDVLKPRDYAGNHLLINDGKGKFREVPKSHADFTWQYPGSLDETTCGVCIGDVNRDGLPDILIGHHFDQPWRGGTPIRLYLNRGVAGGPPNSGRRPVGGFPRFEDVTEKAGLKPLLMKAPHVEIQDFDNDGWPDIYVSIVKFAGGRPYPLIFKNLGEASGGRQLPENLCRFREDVWAVNDWPNAEDLKINDVGALFKKIEAEKKIIYMAPGPSCDYDRDGKLDLFLPNWWVSQRSLLLRNETPGGHWLQVQLASGGRQSPVTVNRMGIGAVVRVYPAGKLGKAEALLGAKEIAIGYGYASGQEAIAHFGLGNLDQCDLEIILPHGKGRLEEKGVKPNQRTVIVIK